VIISANAPQDTMPVGNHGPWFGHTTLNLISWRCRRQKAKKSATRIPAMMNLPDGLASISAARTATVIKRYPP
jgi:hypothetical protein